MLSLKLPVTMARRGHLKIAKNHYFALIFSIKIDIKVLQLLKGLRYRVKGFSALVTHYVLIDLGLFLASHKSKIFLAMWGTIVPLQTLQTQWGTSPFWQPPDVPF
jgi:hypothetical protein